MSGEGKQRTVRTPRLRETSLKSIFLRTRTQPNSIAASTDPAQVKATEAFPEGSDAGVLVTDVTVTPPDGLESPADAPLMTSDAAALMTSDATLTISDSRGVQEDGNILATSTAAPGLVTASASGETRFTDKGVASTGGNTVQVVPPEAEGSKEKAVAEETSSCPCQRGGSASKLRS
ncbi:hypothetical protein CLOM_g10467 [Closterium sp. NIES-68]|nr:hypothetical protein CLOM_g10467 [Closterium sp. NIES-68]